LRGEFADNWSIAANVGREWYETKTSRTEQKMTTEVKPPFEIRTHNGIVTMRSLSTGNHRTFKVWRQPKDSKFFPNERLVGLLQGSDNTNDFQAFGMIGAEGTINLWRKHQGGKFFEWAKACLESPEKFLHQVEFNFEGRCRMCNRPLTTPESVEAGIGPVCDGRGESPDW
jgi:hypothetical protein